jgi:hypothetical protein
MTVKAKARSNLPDPTRPDRQLFRTDYQISSYNRLSATTTKPKVKQRLRATAMLFNILHNITTTKNLYFSKIYCHTNVEMNPMGQ